MERIHKTAIIEEGAIIGEGVRIGAYSIIGKDVKIGKNTEIQSHVVIEGITEIGEENTIYSFVSIGKNSQDLKYAGEPTKTVIGNKNQIREFVTIHRGTTDRWETRIGKYSMIGGASAINQDICPFMLAEGNKAEMRSLNGIGLKRRGFSREEIINLKNAYKIIFRSSLSMKEILEKLKKDFENDKNIEYLYQFIEVSNQNRGLTR